MQKKLFFAVACLIMIGATVTCVYAASVEEPTTIIGYHDEVHCGETWGWVKKNNSETPVKVGIWLDYPADSVLSQKVAEITADKFRPDLPFTDKLHGFTWYLPEKLKDTSHELYVYVLADDGIPQKLLPITKEDRNTSCNPGEIFPNGTYIKVKEIGLKVYTKPQTNSRMVRDIWGRTMILRKGIVLKVNDVIYDDANNPWYRFSGDLWNRYGSGRWFIKADNRYIQKVNFQEEITVFSDTVDKSIEVDLTKQKLIAWEQNDAGDKKVAFETLVSTGIHNYTKKGTFKIYSFRIHSYMKGWDYDLPGVPFDMYFDGGRALHGAYWHNSFGSVRSHGCVNLPLDAAEWLWFWADGKHLTVVIH